MRIALMIGSLRNGSYNAQVARAMTRLAQTEVDFVEVRIMGSDEHDLFGVPASVAEAA